MKPELSKLNKAEFDAEMKRRDEEMKRSSKENSIGLKMFGSAFFRKKVFAFIYAIFRAFLIIGLSYIVLYPALKMISEAFSEDTVSAATSIWIPNKIGIVALQPALKLLNYGKSFTETALISFGSAILQVISSAFVAYGFARFKFKGRNILFAIVILTMIVPPQTYLISSYLIYRKFDFFILKIPNLFLDKAIGVNLLGTPWTMWIPAILGVGLRGGLFIYIFRQFFIGMSKELEEAAYIDGCGPFKTFLKIMAPNSLSSALVVFLLSLVWHWNDYYVTSMMYAGKSKVLPLTLNLMMNWGTANQYPELSSGGLLGMMCLVVILPLIVVFAIAQKYFIESVDKVGIKG